LPVRDAMEHAAFVGLPKPRKWNHQFNVLEKLTNEAVQKIKEMVTDEVYRRGGFGNY
jgi:hypothetical protein